jgi:hydroxyacylglutathione hydrolase
VTIPGHGLLQTPGGSGLRWPSGRSTICVGITNAGDSMRVLPVKTFGDNYAYLLVDESRHTAAVVDPGQAGPVREWLARGGLKLAAILATHHHDDHVGGIGELVTLAPGIPVLGAAADKGRIPHQTDFLEDGDPVEAGGMRGTAIATPGHTRGGVAYFFPAPLGGDLFAGDTLFGGTMGNLFEGTPDRMRATLKRLRDLPERTRLWPGHEYTESGVRDALRLQPDDPVIVARMAAVEAALARSGRTIPLSLDEERRTNPFLRWDDPDLRALLGTTGDKDTFRKLCEVL